MKKVFILKSYDVDEGEKVVEVYKHKDKAEKERAKKTRECGGWIKYFVESHEVIK